MGYEEFLKHFKAKLAKQGKYLTKKGEASVKKAWEKNVSNE